MSTISENLLALAQCKADIKAAIIAKGVEVLDSDAFSTYATKISQIPSGGGRNPIYYWDFTSNDPLVDTLQGKVATLNGTGGSFDAGGYQGVSATSFIKFGIPLRCYTKVEVEVGSMFDNGIDHNAPFICYGTSSGSSTDGLKYLKVSGYWALWTTSNWENMGIGGNTSYFQNSKVTVGLDFYRHMYVMKDDVLLYTSTGTIQESYELMIGASSGSFIDMVVKSVKYYELEH